MSSYVISGERPVARCDQIGRYPFSENSEFLERTYLTPSHRRSVDAIKVWMVAAGMSVRLDAVGNLVGRYEGTTPDAKALLIPVKFIA